MDRGYIWSPVGQRAWRMSDCPSLSERVNWYGAYDFTIGNGNYSGQEEILATNFTNGANFLRVIRVWTTFSNNSLTW